MTAWTAHHPYSEPVTLWDGRVVASDSSDWQEQCEVVAVLEMLPDRRRSFVTAVYRRRGEAAGDALVARCDRWEPHYVASLPDRDLRHAYLSRFANTRGNHARDCLEADARKIFASRIAKSGAGSA